MIGSGFDRNELVATSCAPHYNGQQREIPPHEMDPPRTVKICNAPAQTRFKLLFLHCLVQVRASKVGVDQIATMEINLWSPDLAAGCRWELGR